MKIAIHEATNPDLFFKRWIEYCKTKNIPYKIVNVYANDIINQLNDCTALMWHFSNYNYKDALFAKQLLYSLETKGLKVFPDFNTSWHFDDKVGQKYLLEAIKAPIVPTYVFYTKGEALNWVNNTTFPKIFKLRSGSGSSNVKLIENKRHALRVVKKAFNGGYSQFDRLNHLKFRYGDFRAGKDNFLAIIKGLARLLVGTEYAKRSNKEKSYVYFQDYIPNNKFDIRVVVVGDKAFALKRLVRKGDFRASGGGLIIYDKDQIDERCVKVAFEVNKKISAQSIAYDFVFDNNLPLIIEISYGYSTHAYDLCEGYWDSKLQFHKTKFNPQAWMVENLIRGIG